MFLFLIDYRRLINSFIIFNQTESTYPNQSGVYNQVSPSRSPSAVAPTYTQLGTTTTRPPGKENMDI